MGAFHKLSAFGVSFHALTFNDLLGHIFDAAKAPRRMIIGYVNLHAAYVAGRDAAFAGFLNTADLVYADGMPLIVWRKLLWKDCHRTHRHTLSQTLPALLDFASNKGLRVFYLGSETHVVEAGLVALRRQHGNLAISGCSGFFDKQRDGNENAAVIARINAYRPDILMVGMGIPIQERWVLDNADRLDCPVIYCTGAAIEYFSGFAARPPAWVSNGGLEWLFRLIHQPRKLWRRYLIEPVSLLAPALRDVTRRLTISWRPLGGRAGAPPRSPR